jgi:hypothetical protein
MANTLNYLDIKHVLTSCGTCIDQLMTYELGDIFKGATAKVPASPQQRSLLITSEFIILAITVAESFDLIGSWQGA